MGDRIEGLRVVFANYCVASRPSHYQYTLVRVLENPPCLPTCWGRVYSVGMADFTREESEAVCWSVELDVRRTQLWEALTQAAR